jgi:predicted Zn-dependent protease
VKAALFRIALPAAAAGLLLAGCQSMQVLTDLGATVAEATGEITPEQAQSIRRVGEATAKAGEDITPEQEYYIGRTVAATLLNDTKPFDQDAANEYLNLVGQSLSLFSTRPELFLGYRFLIMDTDAINAFGCPGGFILVSRGMLRCATSEDALAAVLAHEIGHVQNRHGLKAIDKSRITSALTILAAEAGKNLAGQDVAELTKLFEGAIGDVTATLVNSGYARKYEREADEAAVAILTQAGYAPRALVDMLRQMEKNLKPGGLDFAKTHPPPKDRIEDVETMLKDVAPAAPAPGVRQKRFERAMGGV